jgi:23S rRNA (guanosine2251-2'-O)-methyltransferase
MMQNDNFFWVGGKNTIHEILKWKKRSVKQILSVKKNQNTEGLQETLVDPKKINKIFKDPTFVHQGLAALIEKTKFLKDKDIKNIPENSNVVLLDSINDIRNIGSIIRNCAAFEISYLIIEKKINIDSHYLFKSASGATEHVRFIKVSNLNNAIQELKKNGFFVFVTSLNAKKEIKEINFGSKNCIVLGSEGEGVRNLISKNSDDQFKIEHSSKVNSLNVSNTSAIIFNHLYQNS